MENYQRGFIFEIFPDTYQYKVLLHSGGFVWTPVQFKASSPERGGTALDLLKRGTEVFVDPDSNPAQIIGVVSRSGIKGSNIYSRRKFLGLESIRESNSYDIHTNLPYTNGYQFGGLDKFYCWAGSEDFRDGQERSLMGGDYIRYTDAGNGLAVLEGGYTCLKSNDLAQLEFFKEQDEGRMTTRRYKHWSDFGAFEFYNDGGDTGVFIKGCDYGGPNLKDFYYWGMGARDQGIVRRIKILDNDPLFQEYINQSGDVATSANSFFYRSKSNYSVNARGPVSFVAGGPMLLQTPGSITLKAQAGHLSFSSQKLIQFKSTDHHICTFGRDFDGSYGGSYSLKVGGPLDGLSAPGYELAIARGDIKITQGNPLQGNVGTPTNFTIEAWNGSYSYTTKVGNISHKTLAGNISLETQLGTISGFAQNGFDFKAIVGDGTLTAGKSSLSLGVLGTADLTGAVLTTLGGGKHPLAHGDTLVADLAEFLRSTTSAQPGSPVQNAIWITKYLTAATLLSGKLSKWLSSKVTTA